MDRWLEGWEDQKVEIGKWKLEVRHTQDMLNAETQRALSRAGNVDSATRSNAKSRQGCRRYKIGCEEQGCHSTGLMTNKPIPQP